MNSSTDELKLSYGWWTRMSPSDMAAKMSRTSSSSSGASRRWVTGTKSGYLSSPRSTSYTANRPPRSIGAAWATTSASVSSSSSRISSSASPEMSSSTSRRTALPNRRRRNSISMAARRSSASSSSTVRSALRVTRNATWSTTSMPGNRRSMNAAMTCSSGTNRSPSGMTTKRGSRGGTFTRANRRWSVVGSWTITPRLSDRLEM